MIKDKIFVFGGTKTGTSHCEECLKTMFPDKRISSCSKQGDNVWVTKLLMEDYSFLEDADIFLDGGRWDYVLPDNFLSQLNTNNVILLNRNPIDWLHSEMAYFDDLFRVHHKTPKKLLLYFFYNRNLMYYNMHKYNFRRYRIGSCVEMIDWLCNSFDVSISETDLTRLRETHYNSNTYDKEDPEVLEILQHLKITPEEAASEYIMRLL